MKIKRRCDVRSNIKHVRRCALGRTEATTRNLVIRY